jgi:hypothetical protein
MKGRFLMLGALCALAAIVAVTVWPEAAFAATGRHAAAVDPSWGYLVSQATPVLLALRSRLTETTAAATAKIAEVVDGLEPDAVRWIEQAHQTLLTQAEGIRRDITAEEARIAALPSPSPAPDLVALATARAADITSVGMRAGWSREDIDAAIRGSESVDQVRGRAFEALTGRAGNEPIVPRAQIQRDEGDTLRRGVETAIFLRANPGGHPVGTDAEARAQAEQAREFRGMSLLETFRVFHERSGGSRLSGLSRREMASLALGRPASFGLRMHATSDFPIILANVASRRLRDAYGVVQRSWVGLGRQSNAPDLKSKDVIALSGLPSFKPIVEGGEYTYASFGESKETYALAKYGRAITITEEALINDDLGAFNRLPEMIGRAAAEIQNDLVWGMLTAASPMSDGVDLFHATHKNLGTAADITEASLAQAEQLLSEQLDASGKTPLNLRPRTLVVSPKRKIAAQKILGSISATKSGDVNPFVNAFHLIVEARLKPSTGTEPWFLFGDPGALDTFEFAYLDGEEGVIIETRNGFDVDGLQIKGRIFFAAKAIDHRNMVKNAGV